ncbi:hypothetical protein P4H71_11035 [Paenibacillus kribbensis]|uniref:TRADD-N-associated membrane domain-containing protein n=1 Tax=Paenibacillus kribbensis TaxID=172713 RepID=UPI002DB6CD1B|nr:hypothetical protein [Paenibacillus kribbensis]MEC0234861.1 hypothetical protein [Paenibacillus kribbensis]
MNYFLKALEIAANQLRELKTIKKWSLGISIFTTIGSIILLILTFQTDYYEVNELVTNVMIIFMVFSVLLLFVSILSFSKNPIKIESVFEIQLEELNEEREKLKKRISDKPKDDIFTTIQLNLNQTTEYYTINKSQARKSFNSSIFAMTIGMLTVVVGIWLFYSGNKPRYDIATMTTIAGVLIEFISGAYFYVYNKSLNQLNHFYDKLERMQDTMLAIELCNDLKDEEKKNEMKEKIILNLLSRSRKAEVEGNA